MSAVNKPTGTGFWPALVLGASLLLLLLSERVVVDPELAGLLRWCGAVGMGATLALRLVALRASAGQARQGQLRLLLYSLGVAAALGIYALSTPWGTGLLGLKGEAADKAGHVLEAAWVAVMTLSLLTGVFLELSWARMPVAEAVELRRLRQAGQNGLGLALALVFLFSINYAAARRDMKKDLSYFRTALPGGSTQAMVDKLGEPVVAVLFFEQVSDVLEQVRPFFDDLAARSPHFSYQVRDHALAPELARRYRVRGNGHVLLLKGGAEAVDPPAESTEALASQTFELGDQLERARGKLKKLDEHFQQGFMTLTRPPRSLHLTSGHRELSKSGDKDDVPGQYLTGVHTLLGRFNIQQKELGMADGLAREVPEDARAVAVIGPRDRFLPEESAALLAYVQRGGRLLLALDPQQDVGLDPLLHGLGLERLPGVACSERHFMRRRFNPSDAAIVYSNSYSSHPTVTTVSRNAARVATIFMDGGALERYRGKDALPKAKVTFPLRSSHDFWRDLNGDFKRDPDEKLGNLNLMAAVTLEGGAEQGRVVVVANGAFASDALITNSGNVLLFVDALRWLIGEEEIAGDLSSEEDVPIEHRKEADRLWFYATSFGLPLPILLLGLWIARRRKRKGGVQQAGGR